MNALKPKDVEAHTREHVGAHAFAWPQILDHPTSGRADGRFVKAFPLVFPMGVADLYQPRLRSDFHVVDAVQHLFRYHTGHLLRSNDGHRATWALFNTALREIGYDKGGLVHKNVNEHVLTKQELSFRKEIHVHIVAEAPVAYRLEGTYRNVSTRRAGAMMIDIFTMLVDDAWVQMGATAWVHQFAASFKAASRYLSDSHITSQFA